MFAMRQLPAASFRAVMIPSFVRVSTGQMHLAPEIPFAVDISVDEVAKRCIRGRPVKALLDQGFQNIGLDLVHPRGIAFPLGEFGCSEDEPSKRDAGYVVAARSPEPSLLIPVSLLALSLVSQALSA